MSRKIPPEEYTKYGKFIEDEEQYDCRTIDAVLEIIDEDIDFYTYSYRDGDVVNAFKDFRKKVLALKGEQE